MPHVAQPRRARLGRRLLLALLLSAASLAGAAVGAALSQQPGGRPEQADPAVAHAQQAFFEAWLGRKLRDDELRQVADEFIAFFARKGMGPDAIREATRPFVAYTQLLRERPGTPLALQVRHLLLEANYFLPEMQGTTELRLLVEPDPPRVVDRGGKHLMTAADVEAFANLIAFSRSADAPQRADTPRTLTDRLAVELDRAFGDHRDAVLLPRYHREASALWAGILREWPGLTADEKRQVRAYVAKGNIAPMDSPLYGKLLDLQPGEAFAHRSDDITVAFVKLQMNRMVLDHLGSSIDRMFRELGR